MTVLPVVPIERSALLRGQVNGKLDPSILWVTPGRAGGPPVTLVVPAARSWRAMAHAAAAAGHVLKATSAVDSYREYAVQEKIFRYRYQTAPIPTTDIKIWQGRKWYKKPGMATAAAPGTSNHGWAGAVDSGTELDADAGTESLDPATLKWLLDNAHLYGWSWELQSEPWHLHYFAGDAIPAAVLAYEASQHPPPPIPIPEDDMNELELDKWLHQLYQFFFQAEPDPGGYVWWTDTYLRAPGPATAITIVDAFYGEWLKKQT